MNRVTYGECLCLFLLKIRVMNNVYCAHIVDTLRLHALEKERLELARSIAEDIELDYKDLTLVKVYKDIYVYAVDLDEQFEHEAITVDTDGEGGLTFVYSTNNGKETVYFISEELNNWRYDFYLELLKITKEKKGNNGFDERWAFDEATCLSKEGLVEAMTWNAPKEYAEIISM